MRVWRGCSRRAIRVPRLFVVCIGLEQGQRSYIWHKLCSSAGFLLCAFPYRLAGAGLPSECIAKPFGHSTHEVGQFALSFSGLALEPLCGSGSFSLEHWPQVQKFKKERGHNADCPQTHIVALVVDGAGLLHPHKASLFQQGYGSFTAALTYTGITGNGSHVYVDEVILKRMRSKAKRRKIKMGQDSLNDDLTRLTAF